MVSERRRFLVSFGALFLLVAIANLQVIMRSGMVLDCSGIQSSTVQFNCERWRSIGLLVSPFLFLYPIAYFFEVERDTPLFAD